MTQDVRLKLVLVVGTATEVGKTYVGAAVARELRSAGLDVRARKPAQSFDPADPGPTDAEVLAAATGEAPADVCPQHRWYRVPMAPPMAAAVLRAPALRLSDLVDEIKWPPETQIGLVETVGGVRSPLADDGDAVDLAKRLQPDLVLLVADPALGAINAVRLSVAPLAAHDLVVHLNRYDGANDLHRRTLAWLTDRDGFTVTTDIPAVAAELRSRLGAS